MYVEKLINNIVQFCNEKMGKYYKIVIYFKSKSILHKYK